MRSGGLFPLAGSRAWFGVARESDWLCLPFPRRAVCDSGAPRGPRSTGCVQRPHSRSARFRTLPCGLSVGSPTNRLSRCDRILSRRTSIIMPPEPGNKSFGVHSYLCAANAFASPRPSFCHGERRAGLRSDADQRFNHGQRERSSSFCSGRRYAPALNRPARRACARRRWRTHSRLCRARCSCRALRQARARVTSRLCH